MITRKSLKKEIDSINILLAQLSHHAIHQESLHTDIDGFILDINVKISNMQSQLESISSKVEFLDRNRDAIEMWIECVRQTQHLYEESQQLPAATVE